MIARVWKCIALPDYEAAYVKHFEHNVSTELKGIEGYRGAYVLRRNLNGKVEITVMTMWESMDAIHKFAGEVAEIAVVAPEAQAILDSFDSTAVHYEISLNDLPKLEG